MTTPSSTLAGLAGEKFVQLTTQRRDGTTVSTTVWIAVDEAQPGVLWVTTSATSGKVKRVRHTPRVVLVPCDRRGVVAPGAPPVEAVAEVFTDPATLAAVQERIRRKYRAIAIAPRVLFAVTGALRRLRRKPAPQFAALRLSAP